MDQSKIAVRYAKAFFSLAKEKNKLDKLTSDIELVTKLVEKSEDFNLLLETPIVKTSQKIKLIDLIFEGKVDDLSLKFLKLIFENKREAYIPGICRNFLSLYRKHQGVKTAVVTSAIPLNKNILAQIQQKLESAFNAKVEVNGKVNEELIGGFVLRVDDQQIDASMATQLRKVKEKLLQTEINK